MLRVLRDQEVQRSFQIDVRNSWLFAAMEAGIPVFVPGWEDSTLGNMYAGHCIAGDVKNVHTVRTGIDTMIWLAEWYTQTSAEASTGFFQLWGWHRERFSDLPSAPATAGFAVCRYTVVGLDLTNGACTSIAWITFANPGWLLFMPVGSSNDGDSDWVGTISSSKDRYRIKQRSCPSR